ncbi:hypothetical protein PVAP13_3NG205201 [Panicum virgatum]|uniref:Uncharacterized protein n=1 Tax=Panicum virgatum TaxID=38727 RepID=A0A8T0UFH2_PANVG|nr:hypothetical protein PVAP13_3NG205201 [Panicum virgatum]
MDPFNSVPDRSRPVQFFLDGCAIAGSDKVRMLQSMVFEEKRAAHLRFSKVQGGHAERSRGLLGGEDDEIKPDEVATEAVGDLVGRRKDIQSPGEGVVGGGLPGARVEHEDVAALAHQELPHQGGVLVVGKAREEDVGAADGGSEVRVGAAVDGHEWGRLATVGDEEEPEERGAGGAGGSGGGRSGRSGRRRGKRGRPAQRG